MSWTKGQIVAAAFEELGLAEYVFDLQPEEVQTGLRKLDAMMAQWNSKGIRIGYVQTADPADVDSATDSGIADSANEAVYTNLALRLAGGFGKTVPTTTAAMAKDGYDTLLAVAMSNPQQMQFPSTLPSGAGNKWTRRNFVIPPDVLVAPGPDGEMNFG